jgi:hypothetical protein
MPFFEVPLLECTVGVWCAVSARKIVGAVFVKATLNSYCYFRLNLTPFFSELKTERRMSPPTQQISRWMP